MRLVSYEDNRGVRLGARLDEYFVDLHAADPELPTCIKRFLRGGETELTRARDAVAKVQIALKEAGSPTAPAVSDVIIHPSAVRLLAPVPKPEKVIGIGRNYADHAKEGGADVPVEPIVFCKFTSTVCAHGDAIRLPRVTTEVDYEAELAVIIGRAGRHIRAADAWDHIAGYCCANDVSARDWQHSRPGGQWLLGKSFDTFAPMGPHMVTADQVPRADQLGIRLRLNGTTMQDANTSQLIFTIPKLLEYISQVCTLQPGDVILTGTPAGTGMGQTPPRFLSAGDRIEIEIDGLGQLVNEVVAES